MKGVLLLNTGSPVSLSRKDVRSFVGAMLSDPMVMTVPNWFRPILVKGIILPFRQFSSTKKYSLIWDKENDASPLYYHMQRLAEKLSKATEMPVEAAMRYEEPYMKKALDRLNECGLTEVVVLPMFPHYAESSYGTTVKELNELYAKGNYSYQLRVIEPYFSNEFYIESLVESIKPHLKDDFDRLIFTYHSLPISHVEEGVKMGPEFDYVFQTKETTRLVVQGLGLNPSQVRQVFSCAMGSNWLKPSLIDVMRSEIKNGDKKIVVVSAGFAVDNLETLYDVGVEAAEVFDEEGGEEMRIVPCLNSEDYWVKAIQKIIL